MSELVHAESKRREHLRDAGIGAVAALGAAIYLALIPSQVQPLDDGLVLISGRTLPYLVGATMLLLGVVLCVASLHRARIATPGGAALVGRKPARVLAYALAIVLYTLGIGHLGYVTTSVAMLVFAMWFSGLRRPLVLVVAGIATPMVLYGLFHALMQIPLPDTPLY